MLASGSAWRILEAEHDQLRQLLDAIRRALEGEAWRQPGPGLEVLRALVQDFQEFEMKTHRPKGVVLLGSVRGRLAEADRLLDEIEAESDESERCLLHAVALLDALSAGGEPDRGEISALLGRHRELMTRQLDQEDTALRSYTAQLLTAQEWSSVVSSISKVVQQARRTEPRR